MKLSADQKIVLEALKDWYLSVNRTPYITLGGYAGTGKTTLIAQFRKNIVTSKKIKVAFVSFTGKSARVLGTKLKEANVLRKDDFVGTIHSLIYSPITNENEVIVGWERKMALDADLLIIDEASMVNSEIWRDLLSYKIPIIAVGDHGQLPPIRGKFNLMENPILKLEKIHRQAEGNLIIKLSILARERGSIPVRDYSDFVKKFSRSDEDTRESVEELLQSYNNSTLVLCGYNSTRVKLNRFIREEMRYLSVLPVVGDRVICLRNNHAKGLFNGMLGVIKRIKVQGEEYFDVDIQMDGEKNFYSGIILSSQFGNQASINFTQKRNRTVSCDLFDFGYALTVHKAQGSQAKRVILFEERFPRMDDETWRRWLYTALTRAEEELYVIG